MAGLDGCGKSLSLSLSLCFICTFLFSDRPGFLLFVLYSTTQTTQTSMPLTAFEPAITAKDRPQTLAFDPLGHCDRQFQSSDLPGRGESLYRLSYRGPHEMLHNNTEDTCICHVWLHWPKRVAG
jgi:hypothetical protein